MQCLTGELHDTLEDARVACVTAGDKLYSCVPAQLLRYVLRGSVLGVPVDEPLLAVMMTQSRVQVTRVTCLLSPGVGESGDSFFSSPPYTLFTHSSCESVVVPALEAERISTCVSATMVPMAPGNTARSLGRNTMACVAPSAWLLGPLAGPISRGALESTGTLHSVKLFTRAKSPWYTTYWPVGENCHKLRITPELPATSLVCDSV